MAPLPGGDHRLHRRGSTGRWAGRERRSRRHGEVEAIRQCEGFAGKRLKSPASAEYDLTATRDGGQWVVTGTVDSQNGFGAMIRSNVECRITLTDDLATLEAITVD